MTVNLSLPVGEDAAEALKSALIVEYERAIERGLAPAHALTLVLTFAAEESSRLAVETQGETSRMAA
jgi:hypothetical protein